MSNVLASTNYKGNNKRGHNNGDHDDEGNNNPARKKRYNLSSIDEDDDDDDDDDDDEYGDFGDHLNFGENNDGQMDRFHEQAAELMSMRIADGTKYQYNNKMLTITKFLLDMMEKDDLNFSDFLVRIKTRDDPDFDKKIDAKNWQIIKEIPQDVCLAFFGFRCQEQANGKLPSYNSVASCKNALDYYYEDTLKTKMNKITVDKIAQLLTGLRKKRAKAKLDGTLSLHEGKDSIKFRGYKFLVEMVVFGHNCCKTAVFLWCYINLMWNLIQRSNNVALLKFEHIEWSEDAIVITVPKSKGDQLGDRAFGKHIISNPLDPLLDPFLSLGLLILSYDRIDGGEVFQGKSQDHR